MSTSSAVDPVSYSERLGVPLRWWVQGTMFVASLWLAVIVALPPLAAWITTGLFLAVMAALLLAYGNARLVIRDGSFQAGAARIEAHWLGPATALDVQETRRICGVDADARAYLVLRPYLKRAVRVDVVDPADPAPYWLVSTRRPEELARALTTLTSTPVTLSQTHRRTNG